VKIGIFDSGLGGLSIAKAIANRLPQYDYLYLGDTKRVPYGGRSQAVIHEFTSEALNYLFGHECLIVILACNTASSEALRKSQQEYLPHHYPDRRVLGVVITTVEECAGHGPIGVLATTSTVESGAYRREILRRHPQVDVKEVAAPLLVPLIENDGLKYLEPILADYLAIFGSVSQIILGCTHYSLLKGEVRRLSSATVIAQDEVVPEKLVDYLRRHPEFECQLSRNGTREYHVTDLTRNWESWAERLMQIPIPFKKVNLD
jgi:glutamate racemase